MASHYYKMTCRSPNGMPPTYLCEALAGAKEVLAQQVHWSAFSPLSCPYTTVFARTARPLTICSTIFHARGIFP
jgi:hypothetical protein